MRASIASSLETHQDEIHRRHGIASACCAPHAGRRLELHDLLYAQTLRRIPSWVLTRESDTMSPGA